MTFYEGSLIYDVDSGKLRIGLRIYLTAIFLIISFAGNKCCRYRSVIRLLQRKPTPLPLFTGWLSGTSVSSVWYKLGGPPAGFMAYFMVLAALANFAGDVLVSGLVKTIQVPGRCQFGVGVVIPQNATNFMSEPEYNQLPVLMAIQAQNTSLENGGLSGIYWKFNSDPSFRAEVQDVAGNWICDDVHQNVTYPPTVTTIADDDGGLNTELDNIMRDLNEQGLLYANSSAEVGTCVTIWGSAFFASASPQPTGNGTWDVKAVVDADMVDQCVENKTLTLQAYHCSLDAPAIQWVVNNTASVQTIQQWVSGMYGALMDNPLKPTNETLASLLDVLTMVSHGGRVGADDPAWGNQTIGCLADMAAIPPEVFCLLFLVTFAGASMLTFWLALFLSLHYAASGLAVTSLQDVKRRTPNGLGDWMRFALRQSRAQDEEHEALRRWNLALNSEYALFFEDSQQRVTGVLQESRLDYQPSFKNHG
jgi:hypothetical protein